MCNKMDEFEELDKLHDLYTNYQEQYRAMFRKLHSRAEEIMREFFF